jgi:hypothetical protein
MYSQDSICSVVIELLSDDVLSPWFNRQDLMGITAGRLAGVRDDEVHAFLEQLREQGVIQTRRNAAGDIEVALATAVQPSASRAACGPGGSR